MIQLMNLQEDFVHNTLFQSSLVRSCVSTHAFACGPAVQFIHSNTMILCIACANIEAQAQDQRSGHASLCSAHFRDRVKCQQT